MRIAYPLVLFAASCVALGACLFPSFDHFESGGSGAASATSSSTVATGSGGSGAGAGAGGGGGAGGVDAGACAPIDDALAVWPFDDGKGTTARDCTLKSPGTISGATAWVAGRKGGSALNFVPDGGREVSLPANSEVDQVGGTGTTGPKPFTIMTWYNNDIGLNYPRALASRNNNGEAWVFGITGTKTDAQLSLTFTDGVDHYSDLFSHDAWVHLATTFDGGTSINFYVNGKINGHIDIDAGTDAPGDADFRIGSSSAPGHDLTGTLASVRVYTRELSAGEISALAKY